MHVSHQSFSRHASQHRMTTPIDRVFPMRGHIHIIKWVVISVDGKIAASMTDGEVFVWSLDTGERIGELEVSASCWIRPVFSPDSKLLAFATNEALTLWSAATGEHLTMAVNLKSWPGSLAFSPDNKRMALATDCTIMIISAKTGKRLKTLNGHANRINAVAFSPDGKHVASAAHDQVIIWSSETAAQLRVLDIRRVTTLHYDPTGARLLTNRGSFAVMLQNEDDTSKIFLDSQSGHSTTIYGISEDGRWITRAGRKYLFLPTVTGYTISGDTIAVALRKNVKQPRKNGYFIHMSRECE